MKSGRTVAGFALGALALLQFACVALPVIPTPAPPPTSPPPATALPSSTAAALQPSASATALSASPVASATGLPATGLPQPSSTPAPAQTGILATTTRAAPPPTPTGAAGDGPQIRAFSATLAAQEGGEGVLLKWEAVGDRVSICPLIQTSEVTSACLQQLPLQGTVLVPPAEILGNYTGFRAVAQNAQGVAVAEAAVAVRCPGYDTWFIHNPPPKCPEGAPLASAAAAQRFEHGRMIWLEATDQFFALLDGQPGQLVVVQGPLRLKPGASPDNRVGETPPLGHFEPVSGFGLLWRDELESPLNLRAYMGWAVEPEYSFNTRYQCEIRTGPDWNCYLQSPEQQVLNFYYHPLLGYLWAVH